MAWRKARALRALALTPAEPERPVEPVELPADSERVPCKDPDESALEDAYIQVLSELVPPKKRPPKRKRNNDTPTGPHKRPRGRAPLDEHGKKQTWSSERGEWQSA